MNPHTLAQVAAAFVAVLIYAAFAAIVIGRLRYREVGDQARDDLRHADAVRTVTGSDHAIS